MPRITDLISVRLLAADWIWEGWRKVAYLIIGPGGPFADIAKVRPDERFNKFVTEQVRAYVEKGELPHKDIAPAVLNLADDFLAGREMTMRAGDYIALQTHLRAMG